MRIEAEPGSRVSSSRSPIAALPGPRGDLLVGSLREYRRDKVALFLRTARDHGELAALRIGRQRVVLVSSPTLVASLLVRRADSFQPGTSYRELRRLIGAGLVTTAGTVWQQHRAALQPLFRPSALGEVERVARQATGRMIDRLRRTAAAVVELGGAMRELAMDIISTILFGASPGEDAPAFFRAFDVAHDHVMRRLEAVMPVRWPIAEGRFRRAKRHLDASVERLIRHVRAAPGTALLSQMLEARTPEGRPVFTEDELRDECLTLLLAGFDTTATSLLWTLYLLARHDEVRSRIERGDAELASHAVREALRLYPPIWAFSREAARDEEVGGYVVPAGTKIAIAPYCLHRDPRWWPDPEAFRPERFDRASTPPPHGAYLPFGAGPRQCLGRAFAVIVLEQVVLCILTHCRLALVEPQPPAFRAGVFLKPLAGIRVAITPR